MGASPWRTRVRGKVKNDGGGASEGRNRWFLTDFRLLGWPPRAPKTAEETASMAPRSAGTILEHVGGLGVPNRVSEASDNLLGKPRERPTAPHNVRQPEVWVLSEYHIAPRMMLSAEGY